MPQRAHALLLLLSLFCTATGRAARHAIVDHAPLQPARDAENLTSPTPVRLDRTVTVALDTQSSPSPDAAAVPPAAVQAAQLPPSAQPERETGVEERLKPPQPQRGGAGVEEHAGDAAVRVGHLTPPAGKAKPHSWAHAPAGDQAHPLSALVPGLVVIGLLAWCFACFGVQ